MDMTTCYCCGRECYDHPGIVSACLSCSIEVHQEDGGTPPQCLFDRIDCKEGDGFPVVFGAGPQTGKQTWWQKRLDTVAIRHGKISASVAAKPTQTKKSYGDQCPCGLIPSQCTYHS